MDPRVHTPLAGLTQQFTLSKQCYDDELACISILDQIRTLHPKLGQGPGPGSKSDRARRRVNRGQ